jgi:DNA-directed RNA polymerase specialized sigma24 family protein
VDRTDALQALPSTYSRALRLRDEGLETDALAQALDVEPEAVGPLLTLAEAKLAGLMERSSGPNA